MNILSKSLFGLLIVILALAALVMTLPISVSAQDGENQSEDEATETTSEDSAESSEELYTFTAQSGDSFSLIARKSVQIYGIENNVSLSEAEIIAAETWVTQDAGSPALNAGEPVALSKASVKSAVERAQALSDEAETMWAPYAAVANFDTNSVGEAS